ncbi:MAG: hypothetical protein RLZZ546_1867 [Bacteroidota bacterium]|jgi:phage terminase large subunit-like protein
MRYLLFFILIVVFGSCESMQKASFLSNYESFINETKEKGHTYTSNQWDETEKKFKQFTEVDYPALKESLTSEEKAKYNQLTGKYYVIYAKKQTSGAVEEIKNLLEKTKGALDEIDK